MLHCAHCHFASAIHNQISFALWLCATLRGLSEVPLCCVLCHFPALADAMQLCTRWCGALTTDAALHALTLWNVSIPERPAFLVPCGLALYLTLARSASLGGNKFHLSAI